MAIRAVISTQPPEPSDNLEDFWIGAFEADGDEGAGLTVAGIISFLPDAEPARWYRLTEIRELIARNDWSAADNQWTSLQIKQHTVSGSKDVPVRVKMKPAVEDLCKSILGFLYSFDNDNIWVRFE